MVHVSLKDQFAFLGAVRPHNWAKFIVFYVFIGLLLSVFKHVTSSSQPRPPRTMFQLQSTNAKGILLGLISLWETFSIMVKQPANVFRWRNFSFLYLLSTISINMIILRAVFEGWFLEHLMFTRTYVYIETMEQLAETNMKILVNPATGNWLRDSSDPVVKALYERRMDITFESSANENYAMEAFEAVCNGTLAGFGGNLVVKWFLIEYSLSDPGFSTNLKIPEQPQGTQPIFVPFNKESDSTAFQST